MYCYTYDKETGGILLNDTHLQFSKEPRPVYSHEMDILGFDKRWKYKKQDAAPYMWAESNAYYYRGKLVAKTNGGSLYELPTVEYLVDESGKAVLPEGKRLKPVDLETMVEKNRVIMNVLEQTTVQKIFDVYKRHRKRLDCFHVAFSGGKDSVVLLDLVKKALPHGSFVVVFGDTGMEFPDTYNVIDQVEKQCEADEIKFYRASSHLKPEESWKLFGPPSRVLRWCCTVHKSTPQTLKLREITGKDDFVGLDFVGVRAQESASRSEYKYENYGKKQRGQYSHNSILEWHSGEVWLYIYEHNLIINNAYKIGNSRAGCLFCPMTQGKSAFFRYNSYPKEIDTFINIIHEKVLDPNIDTYITNGGWIERKNGRDLANNPEKYKEIRKDGFLYIIITKSLTNWREWIKTLGDLPFDFEVEESDLHCTIKVKEELEKSPYIKRFKNVFHKAAYCIGCRVCETNCKHNCISFTGGLHINNCKHCGDCHNIDDGCVLYHSIQLPINGGHHLKSLNSFADHAPKFDWIKSYFENPVEFLKDNSLGPMQISMFKRFLGDAKLIEKAVPTPFTDLVLNIGWDTDTAWGLILTELANNNPQIRWYIQNMTVGETYDKKTFEEKLLAFSVSIKDANSIRKSFGRLCNIPLGTALKFGNYDKQSNIETLCRTKCNISDARVILYGLYKFSEACEGYYQFSLSRLMDFNVDSAGISPAQIFGIDRDEMEGFLNGLSAAYPEFINATFTHDLDKISLREDKTSQDVLELFNN